jgi:phosphoribosylamine-glycine ligase
MNKHILIVGKQFSTLKKAILEQGNTYTLLRDRDGSRFTTDAGNRVMCDFGSKEAVLKTIDSLKNKPDCVITTYENYVRPTSWIATHLGLPSMPEEAAIACTDKELMRTLFSKAPEQISPEFKVIHSAQDVIDFANTHDFPLIIKPANLAKSLLVTKSADLDELLLNYTKTAEQVEVVYKKYAPNVEPKLLIEEFLVGSIHSVDAFVDNQSVVRVLNEVVDYQTGYDIGYDDNFHYSRILPSALSSADQEAIRHCAKVGIHALGMKNSPAHVEVILTPKGPRIVEIGARNGGYRERMHGLANGIDITGAAIATALGEKPNIASTRTSNCAVLELFPKQAGIFEGINHYEQLRDLESFNYCSIKARIGELVGKSSDGYKMCAVIMLVHDDESIFKRDLEYVRTHCIVRTSIASSLNF